MKESKKIKPILEQSQQIYNALIQGKKNDVDFFQVVREVATGDIRLNTNSEKLRSPKQTIKFLKNIIKSIKQLDENTAR